MKKGRGDKPNAPTNCSQCCWLQPNFYQLCFELQVVVVVIGVWKAGMFNIILQIISGILNNNFRVISHNILEDHMFTTSSALTTFYRFVALITAAALSSKSKNSNDWKRISQPYFEGFVQKYLPEWIKVFTLTRLFNMVKGLHRINTTGCFIAWSYILWAQKHMCPGT